MYRLLCAAFPSYMGYPTMDLKDLVGDKDANLVIMFSSAENLVQSMVPCNAVYITNEQQLMNIIDGRTRQSPRICLVFNSPDHKLMHCQTLGELAYNFQSVFNCDVVYCAANPLMVPRHLYNANTCIVAAKKDCNELLEDVNTSKIPQDSFLIVQRSSVVRQLSTYTPPK